MQALQNDQVSFFKSILPGLETEDGKTLNNKLSVKYGELFKNGNLNVREKEFENVKIKDHTISQLTILLLNVAIETGEAIADKRYKVFDALVGNFGCQITALDVYGKVSNKELCEEAKRVSKKAREKLKNLMDLEEESLGKDNLMFFSILTKEERQKIIPMSQILQKAEIDFPVSIGLRDLCRFRLLQLINDNKLDEKNGCEMPFTNISLLFKSGLDGRIITKKTVEQLINAIQIEEANKAASFIQQVALRMNIVEQRTEIIKRLLEDRFKKTYRTITSLPLNYNTEACLRSFQGILLIKNKLFNYLAQPIEGAISQKLFLKMPGETILNDKEITELSESEPLIVLEGVVRKEVSLAETIMKVGLYQLILSNCAELPQYANLPKDDPGLIDNEAQLEIKRLKDFNLSANKFYLDHFYCASAKEERK